MEPRTIKLIKLTGGIGNQLFQYFFGLFLQETFHCRVKFFLEFGKSSDCIKKLTLLLGNEPELAHKNELSYYGYMFHSQLSYRIIRKTLLLFPFLNDTILVENGSQYNNKISTGIIIFDGYWQSEKYLHSYRDDIQKRITFPKEIVESISLRKICSTNSVCIHVRLGDYMAKENKSLFAMQDIHYYKAAIELIKKHTSRPLFYVFSNDIELAKKMFSSISEEFNYISNNGSYADLKDLYIMTKCRHAIISNSTFSWWGAWLSTERNRIVVAPKKWYLSVKENSKTKDLFPSDWIRI